jgi:hypothetical protein
MSKRMKADEPPGHNHGAVRPYAHCGEWARALQLWRTVPAHGFDAARRAAVTDCMRRTSSTIKVWRDAIGGDAASAIGLALRMDAAPRITPRADLTMTVLLACALRGSAGAALVLSHLIRHMPIEGTAKGRLATSWLVRNLEAQLLGFERPKGAPHLRRRCGIAAQLLGKEDLRS